MAALMRVQVVHIRSNGGSAMDNEAGQQLLPANGDIEMMSVQTSPLGAGSTARRRARVLKRLESLNPEYHGIDKQQLVRITGKHEMLTTIAK